MILDRVCSRIRKTFRKTLRKVVLEIRPEELRKTLQKVVRKIVRKTMGNRQICPEIVRKIVTKISGKIPDLDTDRSARQALSLFVWGLQMADRSGLLKRNESKENNTNKKQDYHSHAPLSMVMPSRVPVSEGIRKHQVDTWLHACSRKSWKTT